MSAKNILFVDDEKSILRSLRRLFRKSGHNLFFAESGREAIEIVKNNNLDIVVSDYMMPQMNGYELQKEVKALAPDTVRIILSGYSDEKVIFKSLFNGVVKIYIAKPWEDEYLLNSFEKVFKFQDLIASDELKDILKKVKTLPTPPRIYNELIDAVNSDKDVKYISKIIETDASISAKILHLVNSAYYGIVTTSVSRAIMSLGLDAVRDLIITYASFDNKKSKDKKQIDALNLLWEHSKYCHEFLHTIYDKILNKKVSAKFFSIGLLCNLGYLIFLENMPDKFYSYLEELKNYDACDFEPLDIKYFGINHSNIGGYLLNWWNIPYKTTETVIYHHKPDSIVNDETELRKYLNIADILAWKKLGYLQDAYIDYEYEELAGIEQ